MLNEVTFSIEKILVAKRRIRLTNIWHFLATGFGIGMFPYIPGTVGSLAAILIWGILILLPWKYYLILIILSIFLGMYCCYRTAHDIGVHDHSCIIWDEFIGIWITLIVLPINNWQYVFIGFFLFRFIDIWKPWPISWLDHNVQGGFGMVIDDIVAGIISSGILYCTKYLFLLG